MPDKTVPIRKEIITEIPAERLAGLVTTFYKAGALKVETKPQDNGKYSTEAQFPLTGVYPASGVNIFDR